MMRNFGGALLFLAAAMTVSGCQGLFSEEADTSIGARRLAQTPDVPSSQRRDEDGFALLGAFPTAAAPQLTDAEVASSRERFNRIAEQRAGAGPASGYAAKVARAERVRRQQASDVAAAVSANPRRRGRPITGTTPDEVLRGIQAEGRRAR